MAALEKRLAETRARLDELDADVERQRREKRELDVEIAIRRGTLELLGQGPGADPENLTSREKAILVKQPSERLGVTAKSLFDAVGIPHGTYHYRLNAMNGPDRDARLLPLVEEAFENSEKRYGYKRVHLELKGMGITVSAKQVMRLMTKHGMVPLHKSAKRYSSYKGELTKAPANLVNRDFHADRPNMLWVTDLTEFSIPAGKAYLPPIIDCYDGLPVAWTIGTSPNAALSDGMLSDACSTLGEDEKPVIHSDRGCHYRWAEWIRICEDNKLTRSMSAKGCSPDNAAAEGFFGRLKQEFFHKRDFTGVTVDGFADDARRVHDMVPRRTHQDRVRDEHHGQAHQAGARRLNTCDNLPDNHTDNEVQQNVATPELVMGLLWGGRGTGEWLGVEASHQCELHACSFPHDVENFVDNLGISWV